jgi:Mg-chelatase subunit ChlD
MKYLDVVNFEAYVSGCAKNSGVRVEWDKPDSTPRTDGRTMWLPAITSKTSDEWLTRMRYFVKHETSHIQYSDFKVLDKYKPTGILALINNLLEDHRVDYINDTLYIGDAITSNKFWLLYTNDVISRAKSADTELSEQQVLTLPLFVWDATLRTWISNASETRDAMSKYLDSAGADRLGKLELFTDELLELREYTGKDANERVFDLAKRILVALYELDPEESSKPEGGVGESEGKGGDADEGTGDAISDDVDRLVNIDKLMESIGHDHKPSRTGIHMEVDRAAMRGSYSIPNKESYVVVKFPTLPKAVRGRGVGYFKESKVASYITSNAKPLSNKLRIKLQTRSRDRYEYGQKKGKLHNGSLHRLFGGDTDSATRVFRKRVVSDTLDTVVTLLVDCSGSMSGNKFEMACAGAGAMAEALKPLNIAYNVLGFTNTEDRDDPIVWVFNDFNERVPTTELVKRFATASGCLWENTDGDAIAYASHALGLRKEKRKVLLVLSDGSPEGRRHAGDVKAYTAKVIKDVENSGVDVYGIGIMDNNVSHYYQKHQVVDKLENLSPTILSILDRSI